MTTVPTSVYRVYMAGDIETAKRWLRQECWRSPLCVTVEPTTFIYTGGEETGFVVGLLDYPRFPDRHGILAARAREIAVSLRDECGQKSALVVGPEMTEWFTREIPVPSSEATL